MPRERQKNSLKRSDDSSGAGWEIVYSGFILILLCFFSMLCSFATMEEAKVMRFVRSFASAVSIFPGGRKFDSGTAVLPESADIIDNQSELAKIFEELEVLIMQANLENDISISLSPKGLVMRLADHALFDLAVADLSREAIPLLDKIGAIIAKTSYLVRIEGHTDNLPIHTQRFPSNWELSAARAVNVLRYFIENHQVPSQRLSAVGFGEYQPLVSNDTIEHRARNRRVEIIFEQSQSKSKALKGED
ncbi:MAG: flagellar motor protein MotB [Desulfobacterales bacterium]|nr:MAG: flagellar motor protein MotB [Desulfobacterales bacterium]